MADAANGGTPQSPHRPNRNHYMKKSLLLLLMLAILAPPILAPAITGAAAFAGEEPAVTQQIEIGVGLLQNGELEKAGEVFIDLLRAKPDSTSALLGVMKVCHTYTKRNETGESIKLLDRAFEFSTYKSEISLAAATILIRQKNHSEAVKRIRTAIEFGPNDVKILGGALRCFAEMERFDDDSYKIGQQLYEAQKDRPIDACMFFGLWHERNKEFQKARTFYIKALSYDTNNIQARLMLGRLYEIMGRNESAEREYIKLMKIVPGHPAGYECLAELYTKMGKKDLAQDYARMAAEAKAAIQREQAELRPAQPKQTERQEAGQQPAGKKPLERK